MTYEEMWANEPEVGTPRYPIYIPSLGRAKTATTWQLLEPLDFKFVVEAQEHDDYVREYGKANVIAMPGGGYGAPAHVRNFIKSHAALQGHAKHWQLDDNIQKFARLIPGEKMTYAEVNVPSMLARIENYVDKFADVGIAGLTHVAFAWTKSARPFYWNQQCYSAVLVTNDVLRWRTGLIEDTDYSLQVLMSGACTLLINEYVTYKVKTEKMAGGNTANIYQGDGRLRNIQGLGAAWPSLHIGMTKRFGLPKADLGHVWKQFDQRPSLKSTMLPLTHEGMLF